MTILDVEAKREALERGPATNYVPDVRNRRALMAHADAYAQEAALVARLDEHFDICMSHTGHADLSYRAYCGKHSEKSEKVWYCDRAEELLS